METDINLLISSIFMFTGINYLFLNVPIHANKNINIFLTDFNISIKVYCIVIDKNENELDRK